MTYINQIEETSPGTSSNVGTVIINVPGKAESLGSLGTGGIETSNGGRNIKSMPGFEFSSGAGATIISTAAGSAAYAPANNAPRTSVDEFYPHIENLPTLRRALDLLDEGLQHANSAVSAYKTEDLIAADDEVQCVNALLPELFCCRTIGDGFGALVNALRISLVNQQGLPLNLEQINGVSKTLRELRSLPYMTFDRAVQVVMELEDSGLNIDPAALSYLAELQDE